MNDHQISEFVNSEDVREYLQSIHYEFNTAQAAWLVHYCRRLTMAERHRAWREIIRDMPDCVMEERNNIKRIDSFHSFLADCMERNTQGVQWFMNGSGCVYSCEYHETPTDGYSYDDGWLGEKAIFSNYSACINYCEQRFSGRSDIDRIRIYRHELDLPEKAYGGTKIEMAFVGQRLEILSSNFSDEDDSFDGMCFDIPIPFRRGDILVSGRPQDPPFVLSYLTTWDSETMLSRGFRECDCPDRLGWEHFDKTTEKILKHGDCTDSHAVGTMINGGNLFQDDFLTLPTDLAYFRGSLEGDEKQLQVFSCYEKGEIVVELLVNACFAIRVNEYAKENYQGCMRPYTKAAMERIGMLDTDKALRQREE